MGKDRPMLMAILSRSSMFCFFLLTPLFIGLAIQSGSGAYLSVQVGLCDARSMTMMMMYYVIDLRDFARSSDSCSATERRTPSLTPYASTCRP